MTIAERNELLKASIPVVPDNPASRRFVVRRAEAGIEIYDLKFTRTVDGEPEFHGHPAGKIERSVLKRMQSQGLITPAEYRRLAKELPGC